MPRSALADAVAAVAAFALAASSAPAWSQAVGTASVQTSAGKPAAGQPAAGQAAAPAQPLTVADVVARYLAWRGGAAFAALRSIRQDAAYETAGGRETAETWLDRQGRRRVVTDFAPGVRRLAVAGDDGAWITNVSGQVLDDPDAAAAARRYAQLTFADALEGRAGATLGLGVTEIDGRKWAVVRAAWVGGALYDAVIDPASGALCCFHIVEHGVTTLEQFGDWRMVDGVRMPFAIHVRSPSEDTQRSVTSTQLDPPLAPELFARPAPARLASFEAGAASSGWIDFDFFAHRQIWLPAAVDGHPVAALLDSGATGSVIDRGFAGSLGLKPVGGASVAGPESISTGAAFLPGAAIAAGKMRLHGVTMAVVDLGPTAAVLGRPLPLVVGQEAFNELVVDIDFANRRVAFLSPEAFEPPAGAVALPLGPLGIPVSIEGGPPANFQVDLGDADAIDLFPAFIAARKLADGRTVVDRLSFDAGGARTDGAATLREVSLAGVRFVDVPADFQRQSQPGAGSDVAGRIGMGLLQRFRVIFDAPHGKLYLVPPGDAATPFDKDRSGLAVAPQAGALAVKLVVAGSPAAAAGFKAGDSIAAVDGKPAGAWTLFQLQDAFGQPAGASVRLRLIGGEERVLKLADYY